MKKLIMAAIALSVSASVTFAQSTTNSTNPNVQAGDTTKENPASDRSTVGPRSTTDGGEHRQQGKANQQQGGVAEKPGKRSQGSVTSEATTGTPPTHIDKTNRVPATSNPQNTGVNAANKEKSGSTVQGGQKGNGGKQSGAKKEQP